MSTAMPAAPTTPTAPTTTASAATLRTARATGLAYLALAVFGFAGYLLIRHRLYVPDDAAATVANLVAHTGLARLGIAVDLSAVLAQAVTALWFWKLFRRSAPASAVGVAAFGLVNAVVLLAGTMFSATALEVALADPAAGGASDPTVQALYRLTESAGGVGALFFGLWLMPMGWAAWRTGGMPPLLGRLLVVGGVGYVVSAYVGYVWPDAGLAEAFTLPATAGELWMVGYLLVRGARGALDTLGPGASPAGRP